MVSKKILVNFSLGEFFKTQDSKPLTVKAADGLTYGREKLNFSRVRAITSIKNYNVFDTVFLMEIYNGGISN